MEAQGLARVEVKEEHRNGSTDGEARDNGGVRVRSVRRSQTRGMLEGTGEVLVKDGNNGRGEGGGDGGGRVPEGGEEGDGLPSIPAPAKAPREGAMYQVEEGKIPPVRPWARLAPADVAAVAKAGLAWSPEDVDPGQARALASALAALRDRDGRLEADDKQGDGVGKGKAKAEESGLRGEAMELGWMVLRATGNVVRAVETAVDASRRMAWSQEEEALFVEGMNEYDKNFVQIKVGRGGKRPRVSATRAASMSTRGRRCQCLRPSSSFPSLLPLSLPSSGPSSEAQRPGRGGALLRVEAAGGLPGLESRPAPPVPGARHS